MIYFLRLLLPGCRRRRLELQFRGTHVGDRGHIHETSQIVLRRRTIHAVIPSRNKAGSLKDGKRKGSCVSGPSSQNIALFMVCVRPVSPTNVLSRSATTTYLR